MQTKSTFNWEICCWLVVITMATQFVAHAVPLEGPENQGNASAASFVPGQSNESEPIPTEIDRTECEQLLALGYIDSSETLYNSDGVVSSVVGETFPGVNLYLSSHAAEAFLMTMGGEVLHRWFIDKAQLAGRPPPSYMKEPWPLFWRKVHLLPGGDLLAIHEGYGIVRLDRHSNVRWIKANGAHHDLWETKYGRIFVLARTLKFDNEVRADGPILNDQILEIDSNGKTIGSWSILYGLTQSSKSQLLQSSHGPPGDPLHCNSIQVVSEEHALPAQGINAGDFVVSCRHIDTVLSVNSKTGLVTWSLEGLTSNQHDARLVDGGRITVFDNADREAGSRATVIDAVSKTALRSWPAEPVADLFSRCCGTTQLLPNGNLLTTFTEASRAVETDPGGAVVWEFRNPHRSAAPNRTSDEERAMLYEVQRFSLDQVIEWIDAPATEADKSAPASDSDEPDPLTR